MNCSDWSLGGARPPVFLDRRARFPGAWEEHWWVRRARNWRALVLLLEGDVPHIERDLGSVLSRSGEERVSTRGWIPGVLNSRYCLVYET